MVNKLINYLHNPTEEYPYAKILMAIIFASLLFLRNTMDFLHPQFWAEDGVVFFYQNINLGFEAFITPYGGYFHTIIRIVVWIASQFPFAWQPAVYNYSAFLIMLFVAVLLMSNRINLPIIIKFIFALMLVLVPTDGELFMNITGIQYITALIFIVLLIQDAPASNKQQYGDLGLATLFSLSGVAGAIFYPLFLAKYFAQKTKYNFYLLFCIGLPSVLQLITIIVTTAPNSHHLTWLNFSQVWGVLPFEYFLGINSAFFGAQVTLGYLIFGALFWIVVPLFLYPRNKLIFFIYGALFLFYFSIFFRESQYWPADFSYPVVGEPGGRHFYLPSILFSWLIFLAIFYNNNYVKKLIAVVFILFMLVFSVRHYHENKRSMIYPWSSYAELVKTDSAFSIPINPAPWKIDCKNRSCDSEKSSIFLKH